MQIEMYKLNDIAQTVSDLGAPCAGVSYDVTPNTIIYHFNLLSIKDLPKIKKIAGLLSAVVHEEVTQATSNKGHFALVFLRSERATIDFTQAYFAAHLQPLEAIIGVNNNGQYIKLSVDDMVSALCVGTSGSGKSTFLHTFINSLCCSTSVDKLGFVLIDCKRSELVRYDLKNAHLLCKTCTTPKTANGYLRSIVNIMQDRYKQMEQRGINTCPDDFKRIVIIVDELAELMLSADKTEAQDTKTMLIRLCQLGRACGIHCLLCTQSPRVAVVDGMIQTNTPTKFALRTSNARESVIAIGHGGCENLLGRGDMLYKPADDVREIRLQVPYISAETITNIYKKLPPRKWEETKKDLPKKKPTLSERVKAFFLDKPITTQDCIDYDLMD